jgi:hypothetical protein
VSSSSSAVDLLLGQLQSKFALKDLGSLSYFLSIEVKKAIDGICLTQTKYTPDLLKRAYTTGHFRQALSAGGSPLDG